MPKVSQKRKLINLLEDIAVHDLLFVDTFEENYETKRKKEHEILEELTLLLTVAESVRYGVPFIHYSVARSRSFLTDVLPRLDELRFRQIVRFSFKTFKVILDLIKDDEVFHTPRSCLQFPIEMQLIITLYHLGSSGEGGTIAKIARFFGIGDGGTVEIVTCRVFKAILRLKNKFLYWPDASERRRLVADTFHELPNCIGYVDGTEIKLAEKPVDDPESYFSRKHVYSLKAQAICDHKLRIRHMVLGYPGSVHDARIYNNCDLSTSSQEFFGPSEWIAGDSAYKLTSTVVTPFRTNSNEGTLRDRIDFNKQLSKYRIRIEHCFGMMKERFGSLKDLRVQIKNDLAILHACNWILVCALLHNIAIEQDQDDNFILPENISQSNDAEMQFFTQATVEGQNNRHALLGMMRELNIL